MNIEKSSLKIMMIINFIVGALVVGIKLANPMYSNIKGIFLSLLNREIALSFFIPLIIAFVIYSYVLFLMGLYIIGQKTIGRLIRFVKSIFSKENNYYPDDYEEYDCKDVGVIAVYILVIIPALLYILWPALTSILVIILIIWAICSC